jgi:DNA uptake protein ComE-like DNA-binding protein
MQTCTYLPTNRKCQVVGQFKDGEEVFYTLKELVEAGDFARSYTASTAQVTIDKPAEVIQISDRREAKARRAIAQQSTAPDPSDEGLTDDEELEVIEKDPDKIYINDPKLTAQDLANETRNIIQGIGPVTAKRILDERAKLPGDRFAGMADLAKVRGINWSAYEDKISFE